MDPKKAEAIGGPTIIRQGGSTQWVGKFESAGQGIIHLTISYKNLFTQQDWLLPKLKSLTFFMEDDVTQSKIYFTFCHLFADKETAKLLINRKTIKTQNTKDLHQIDDFYDQIEINDIFAKSIEQGKTYLQKKLWFEINVKMNFIKLHVGDIQDECTVLYQMVVDPEYHSVEEEVYPNKGVPYIRNRFEHLTQVTINVINDKTPYTESIQILDCMIVNILPLSLKNNPVLLRHPSILQQDIAQVSRMSQGIKDLFDMLEDVNLQSLPEPKTNNISLKDYKEYSGFKFLAEAIQTSLTTKPGYFDGQPVGILNHLLWMKSGQKYQLIDLFKKDEGHIKKQAKTIEELKKEVYERMAYIRFEVLPHEGLSPGSPAVLEIWPPWNSSPIHDHGETDGVIKVLAGTIHVQNFKSLSFSEQNLYLHNDYNVGQYTYFNQYSYNIHRLLNLHNQVCLSLQTYSNNIHSRQYFSFVEQSQSEFQTKLDKASTKSPSPLKTVKTAEKHLLFYYPQHDWKNYLEKANDQKDSEDRQFIQDVIAYYGLRDKGTCNTKSDLTSFVLTMKREWDAIMSRWNVETNRDAKKEK